MNTIWKNTLKPQYVLAVFSFVCQTLVLVELLKWMYREILEEVPLRKYTVNTAGFINKMSRI